jgi:hypothetical protein
MGSITAASLTQSTISAGTVASLSQTGPLLDSADDLAAPAMISEVKLTAPTASFSDSRIAAARLGSMLLGTIVTSNGGVPLGLSAESIATIRAALDSGGSLRLSAKQLASESALTAYLAANSITLGDFAIDLFPAS